MRSQRQNKNPYVILKVFNKMRKKFARGYITEGVILALTSFFYVPKGTDDILIMFYTTVSGINNSLWDPNFVVTSMGSYLIMVGPETHMVDLDVGKMFITFDFHWCWPSITECIWDPIWVIRRTVKEHLS